MLSRLAIATTVGAATLVLTLAVNEATGTTSRSSAVVFHASAVKGQTIELEIAAPAGLTEMSLGMQKKERMKDLAPPFIFSISTDDLRPASYTWHSWAEKPNSTEGQATGGAIRIYPLPKLRAPKVSALVVADTARVVGLIVSKVGSNRVVRAWSFSGPRSKKRIFRIPLKLRRKSRAMRIYRFPRGFAVQAGTRTEIDVEVAPPQRTFRHGVEVRGRLAGLVLRRNRRTGETRAHRVPRTACTTKWVRKGEEPVPFPAPLSCAVAPEKPAVSITCAKSVPCVRAVSSGRSQG